MAADSGGLYEPLHLEPFIHQVGGHSSMLQLDDSTICKPLIPQELNFYGSSPDSLKPYMPEFRGVIEVNFSEGSDGYLALTAYLPESYKFSCGTFGSHSSQYKKNGESKKKHRIRLCQSGSIQIESSSEDVKQLFEEGNQSKGHNGSPLNPWVIHCHQEQLNKIRKSSSATMLIHKYILLENLTSSYEFPCVLDLKMGTRQYGDDASLAKRQSHMAKVASTTSSTLGVRICGMQVYHLDSGHFICHNKYYGRSLTVEGFQQALYHFLHNGNKLRHDVITPLLEKLHHLYAVVQHLDTFRFFTSSLLIIYDGKECSIPTVYNGNNFHASSKCKDGVTLQLSDNGNMNKQTTSGTANSNFVTGHKDDLANVYQAQVLPKHSQQKTDGKDTRIPAPIVDIRMIDFAHSTQSQMKGIQNIHKGPDEGYLFGLKNLIAQLKIIQQESG